MTQRKQARAKSEYLYALALLIFLISVQQIGILEIPLYDKYRIVEGITADALLCLMCMTIILIIPYRLIYLKSLWVAYTVWFIGSFAHNTITQLFFPESSAHIVELFAVSMLASILFAFRFMLKWNPYNLDHPKSGEFHLIIGWPKDSAQYALAAKTGDGGTFAITDGKSLWLCSNETNSKMEIDIPGGFLRGRMCCKICNVFDDGYKQLKAMNDEPYDLVHNCEDYYILAKKWKEVRA